MQRQILAAALLCIAGTPPPPDRVDLKSGQVEPAKRCTRDVFYPCPDERGKNCIRKETYRCD